MANNRRIGFTRGVYLDESLSTGDSASALFLPAVFGKDKAFLVWHDVLPMKIHDLKILGEECARIASSLGSLIPQVASLTAYGSMHRYPGGSELEVNSEDADDAYRCASDTMRVVLARLPAEVFP